MKKLKQASALVAAVVFAASSMAGCSSSTDYSATVDGEKINAGVYINFLMNEMTTQMYTLYYTGGVSDINDCFAQKIDGKDFKTYCKDAAMDKLKRFAVINNKFEELGLELSEEDKAEIKESVDSAWDSSSGLFEYEGISKESYQQCIEMSYKEEAVFDYYYEEGGAEEVTSADVTTYVNNNYIRYKRITVSKSEDAAENDELKALVDGYYEEAKSLSFEEFDKIIDEYADYTAAKAEESDEETAEEDVMEELEEAGIEVEEVTDAEALAVEEGASEAEEGAEEADATEAADAAEENSEESTESEADAENAESEAEESADSEAETEADTDTAEETVEAEGEEDEDPYENEIITDYSAAVDPEGEYYDEENAAMLKTFKEVEYGTADLYETDSAYVLYITADIAERTDYAEDNRESLVHSMKDDEFDGKVESWTKEIKFTANSKAVKKFTVQVVYDRQEEYYNKNNA